MSHTDRPNTSAKRKEAGTETATVEPYLARLNVPFQVFAPLAGNRTLSKETGLENK